DRVELPDPGHGGLGPIPVAPRHKQRRPAITGQQRAVQHPRLPGDHLGPEARQVADVLFLPDQHGIEVRLGHRAPGPGEPGRAEGAHVHPRFVVHGPGAPRPSVRPPVTAPRTHRAYTSGLNTFGGRSPRAKARMFSTTVPAMVSRVSRSALPMWGVSTTF